MDNTLTDLHWKMECKGYSEFEIRFYFESIWMLVNYSPVIYSRINCERELFLERLKQAHIEIDFTNFKK